jgi:hypothetical protein
MGEGMTKIIPTESEEQIALFFWAELSEKKYPDLKWLYHIPNGGYRSKATGGRLKSEGVKPGVPDLCLPVPRGTYHGMYIEMKRMEGGTHTDPQIAWLHALHSFGYYAVTCYGWEDAAENIKRYLKLDRES